MGIGSKFVATSTGQQFELMSITERIGQRKLKEPIYTFRYTNREGGQFTCYKNDIDKSISFKVWKEIKQ